MVLALKSKLAPKVTVWAVISDHISSHFAQFGEKSVFTVRQLSTLVPIKMLVSGLTELHTPRQTLGFSTVS